MADIQEDKENFWKRQFAQEVTRKQTLFDFVFGVISPIALLFFDPIVFTENGIFEEYKVFSFVGIGLSVLILSFWLAFSRRIKNTHGFVAGVFSFGALFAFMLGLRLAPIALMVIISSMGGFFFYPDIFALFWALFASLGMLPIFTALVYARNASRVLDIAKRRFHRNSIQIGIAFVIGIIFIVFVPGIVQKQATSFVSESLELVLSGEASEIEYGMNNLRKVFWCSNSCYGEIVSDYIVEEDQERRIFLAKIYKELTGDELEEQLRYESEVD